MLNLQIPKGLEIIPVINKVDLPSADVERVSRQIEEILAIPAEDAIQASGKSGIGVDEILEAIVNRLPPQDGPSTQNPEHLSLTANMTPLKELFATFGLFLETLKKTQVLS